MYKILVSGNRDFSSVKALVSVYSCGCFYGVASSALRTCVKVFWVAANCKIIQNPYTLMLSSNANSMEEC